MDSKIDITIIPEIEEYLEVLSQDKSKYTIRNYSRSIQELCQFFKIDSLEKLIKVDYKKLLLFRNNLLHKKLEASNINTTFRNIKALFNYLVEHDYVEFNPFSKVKFLKEEKKIKLVLTDAECEAMVNACTNDNEVVIISMLLATGARRSELVNIRVEDVYDGHVRLFGKGNKQREVPIQESVYDFIRDYLKIRKGGEYVVVSQRGSHKVTPEAVRQTIKKIAVRAKIDPDRLENLSCHTFRRTAASNLLNAGVDSFFVRDFLGHSRVSTTETYAKVNNKAMDKAVLANQKAILKWE